MALSNKFGWLVLTTGNKSEMAVGYATLYGDMAGGFAVLKDVPKTLVYRLAELPQLARTGRGPHPAGPPSTGRRPPSWPPTRPTRTRCRRTICSTAIIEAYVVRRRERGRDRRPRASTGAEVERVVAMIDGNEYKRRQAAPGVRITPKAFGKDRRLPITNRYRG